MPVDLPAESAIVPSVEGNQMVEDQHVDVDGDAEIEAQFSPLSGNYLPLAGDSNTELQDASQMSTEEILARAAEGNPIPLPAVPTFNIILATPKTSQELEDSSRVRLPSPLPSLFAVTSPDIETIPSVAGPSQATERPLRRSPRIKSPSPSPQASNGLTAEVVPILRRSPRSQSRSPQPE